MQVADSSVAGWQRQAAVGRLRQARARFRAERGRVIVCALGALHIHVGIADLDGVVIDDSHRAWDIASGPEATLDEAMTMIDALLAEDPETPVWAITVGVPGPVDFASGRPVAP